MEIKLFYHHNRWSCIKINTTNNIFTLWFYKSIKFKFSRIKVGKYIK